MVGYTKQLMFKRQGAFNQQNQEQGRYFVLKIREKKFRRSPSHVLMSGLSLYPEKQEQP